MPSGKVHDAITLLLAPPTFAAAWGATGSWALAAVTTCAMLFGGFMFGPDLDIQSRQYTRWGLFRFIWWPYKVIFRHRSRWSHGIIFGTLIRVIYFTAVLVLLVCAGVYLRAFLITGGTLPDWANFSREWWTIETLILGYSVDKKFVLGVLAGLWWGAASHTLADVGWSVMRKGSEIF